MCVEQAAAEVELALQIKWTGFADQLGRLRGVELLQVWCGQDYSGRATTWYAEYRRPPHNHWRAAGKLTSYATCELARAAAVRAYVEALRACA